jgi:hypothetical protein
VAATAALIVVHIAPGAPVARWFKDSAGTNDVEVELNERHDTLAEI